jgi:hypothetical protein
MAAPTDWITLGEASEILAAANIHCTPSTIGGWARAGRLQSIKLAASTQDCSTEYEYVYAGGQCAVVSSPSVTSTSSTPAATSLSPSANQICPGEYEYVYPGAQCAPAAAAPAKALELGPAPASTVTADSQECAPEYDYIYGGNSCNPPGRPPREIVQFSTFLC